MKTKSLLALVLVLAMVLCALPVVFAEVVPDAGTDDSDIPVDVEDIPAENDVVYGDANGDKVPDRKDAFLILQYVTDPTTACDLVAADVTGDKLVDRKDAFLILQFVSNYVETLEPTA